MQDSFLNVFALVKFFLFMKIKKFYKKDLIFTKL